jgi:hypothetical protein
MLNVPIFGPLSWFGFISRFKQCWRIKPDNPSVAFCHHISKSAVLRPWSHHFVGRIFRRHTESPAKVRNSLSLAIVGAASQQDLHIDLL